MSDMTMVERVARAIYEGRNGPGCMAWSRHSNEHRRPYLADARAAIEAMRVQTPPNVVGTPGRGHDFVDFVDGKLDEVGSTT